MQQNGPISGMKLSTPASAPHRIGLGMPKAEGSYFQLADYSALGKEWADCTDVEFTERLINEARVAVIPLSPFYREPPADMRIVRLCVAKRDETLVEAARRISGYTTRGRAQA